MICYQKNFQNPTQPVDEAQFYALVRSPQWNETIDKFRETGDQALKRKLPAFIFQATFDETTSPKGRVGCWRKQAATRLTGLVVMDLDHVDAPRKTWELIDNEELTIDNELRKQILLVYITPSGKGLKIVFKARPEWGNLIDNQHAMAKVLGVEVDESCKDASRMSFICKESDILYLDKELFTYENKEYGEKYDTDYRAGHSGPTATAVVADKDHEQSAAADSELAAQSMALTFKGRPYKDIIAAYWNLTGGEPQEGERNVKLYQLAVNLRAICDNNKELLLKIMPRLGLSEQELHSIVDSACKETPKGISKVMREILNQGEAQPSDLNPQTSEATPPAMPKKLPKLVELLVSRTPEIYKPAVAHAIFPALATHLWKTKFRYIDNKLHEATLMNCLMAGTGAGKDCISEPIDHIMEDIRQSDAENLKREKEWKNEVNAKGANKDKKQRPEGLVIQEIDADMTNPAFVMRMAEADEHFLYVKLNEIDQFDALKGNGAGGQQFRIMCLAFDPNNRYGQTRIGTQSVTERVCIRFNWNCAGTINKVQRYFSRVLTDGPLSRINFCTIPEREIGAEIPVYGEYGEDFDEALRPYIEHLCAARGEIACPQAFALAKKLNEECAEFSRLSQSRVYENFSFRANVIAYLKACVLFVANDYQWEDTFDDFIRWSLQYDLWCKMQFFGEAIEKFNYDNGRVGKRGPQNLLELLPETFNIDDAKKVRRQVGMDIENVGKMVSQWKTRGYILQLTVDSFQKVKKRPC